MSLLYSAKELRLLKPGVKTFLQKSFSIDGHSLRPSNIDHIVGKVYEDLERISNQLAPDYFWTAMGDTPNSFSGAAESFIGVNTGETALEYKTLKYDNATETLYGTGETLNLGSNAKGILKLQFSTVGNIDYKADLPILSGGIEKARFKQTTGFLGLGTTTPTEYLHSSGGIRVGTATNANSGTFQWNGTNFQGHNGSGWVNLDITDHTLLSNIGSNTHAQIDSHISSTANPHGVTAAQVGNTTAQWNANSIEGNLTNVGVLGAGQDGQALVWDNATSRFITATVSSPSIYTSNDTIGSGRVATITDTLTFDGGTVNMLLPAGDALRVSHVPFTPSAKLHVRADGSLTGIGRFWNSSGFAVLDILDNRNVLIGEFGLGTGNFIVGNGSLVSSEKISFQNRTLVKGADTLPTSTAFEIYDGDTVPSSLWDFRNNGDVYLGKNSDFNLASNLLSFTTTGTSAYDAITVNTFNGSYFKYQNRGGVVIKSQGSNNAITVRNTADTLDTFEVFSSGGGDWDCVNSDIRLGNFTNNDYVNIDNNGLYGVIGGVTHHEIGLLNTNSWTAFFTQGFTANSYFAVGSNGRVFTEEISLRGDTLVGNTADKVGFMGTAPIVQVTTGVAAATFTANTSGIADDTATFDGYTIGQVVKALRNYGLLA